MSAVIVRYKVKPEFAEENTQLVKAVFAELQEKSASGFHYAALLADDGLTFFHVASVENSENPLFECAAFEAFRKDINHRCQEVPEPIQLSEVDSYNFFR